MSEDQQKQLGSILTGLGGVAFAIGVVAKFHRGMLILSNILFFAGLIVILGLEKFQKLFTQKQRLPGTICFAIGLIFILFNKGLIGTIADLAGIYICFGGFVRMMLINVKKIIRRHDEEDLPR
ncbi:hypothetical protein TVAG_375340 [Trichomonas vaginalis G3]|uniref:Uncharacterized protein n=1 Tax=Trichomonas vaginalis (strain ATCC PRA-98 / G3) TaxID=412133 RepID=A2FH12_TRIV3|nr:vesicle-mediated transport [Trichomonas vaginalis G3]EAX95825.1 hypothetical protein TVAG_375340 [Trichomonas vaginalis G3]KAI5500559.1 vesicle-mediated transport [Trichomonas vaginalis G3]|eukprot:XP_001308755.1 hypothetical protein [Trichomonas vaginalis G3]